MIIGICGFAGSGKGTVGDYLEKTFQFEQVSFAGVLKDITAIMFNWDRQLVEGATPESREWREKEDKFWTERFDYKVTPRIILQKMGTEVIRNNLHNSFWLFALERKLDPAKDYVITDVRFVNEVAFLKRLDGLLVRVKRGPEPEYLLDAIADLRGIRMSEPGTLMATNWPGVHASEWQWLDSSMDCVLDNSGTITDLLYKVDGMMKAIDKR